MCPSRSRDCTVQLAWKKESIILLLAEAKALLDKELLLIAEALPAPTNRTSSIADSSTTPEIESEYPCTARCVFPCVLFTANSLMMTNRLACAKPEINEEVASQTSCRPSDETPNILSATNIPAMLFVVVVGFWECACRPLGENPRLKRVTMRMFPRVSSGVMARV